MKTRLLTMLAFLTLALISNTVSAGQIKFNAELTGKGNKVKICATVAENRTVPKEGEVVLTLHGLNHTSRSFVPLTTEIFTNPLGANVRCIISLDLPGRGDSGLPSRQLFGDLSLEDYASILIQTLEEALKRNKPVDRIIAHSMGGLVVQIAQETLLSQGSSLAKLGVSDVSIIGSSSPSEVLDYVAEYGDLVGLINLFKITDETRGSYTTLDEATFVGFFFTVYSANVVPGTPFGLIPAIKAYESYRASVQTVSPSAGRPSVQSGAFSALYGTTLRVITGSEDTLSLVSVQQALYLHLTGDETLSGFRYIEHPFAVHDGFISNPELFMGPIFCP